MGDIQNKAEELGGKAKEAFGDATGNERLEAEGKADQVKSEIKQGIDCLLYTSPSPRDKRQSRMPSSA